MTVHYADETVTLHHGNCLDILATIPDASMDAVVTDPPYGLSNTTPQQVADTLVRWVNGDRDYIPSGSGFMGREWDAFVPPVAVWDECFRVLKPGGHVLAFAGSRTHDLMTLGIRLAGFDIRDSVAWLYGSGFPKSLDVSKAIDKARGDEMDWRRVGSWLKGHREAAGFTRQSIAPLLSGHRNLDSAAANMSNWENGLGFPTLERWDELRSLIGFGPEMDAEVLRLNLRKGESGEAWRDRPITGLHSSDHWSASGHSSGGRGTERRDIPATPDAERWQGWGTALKPAFEPVVVARKPLAGTVASNVLTHGTGALNIEGCRIGTEERTYRARGMKNLVDQHAESDRPYVAGLPNRDEPEVSAAGRWPANVILDEDMAGVLDEQSGTSKSPPVGGVAKKQPRLGQVAKGDEAARVSPNGHGDSGGASRFFYVAKAPKRERPVVDGVAHPTVKPLALMRWLVRLVTPPGGTVLEPFAGSGTTVEACVAESFQCVAIEREADYLPLILERIRRQQEATESADPNLFNLEGEGA